MQNERLARILVLLRDHDQVTAATAANEVGVSVPTIRRDFALLRTAGIALTAARGRRGGWSLATETRNSLTGWTTAELDTAFRMLGPETPFSLAIRSRIRPLVAPGEQAPIAHITARVTAPNSLVGLFRATVGINQVEVVGPDGPDRSFLKVASSSPQMVARQLAGWAPEIEVIGPASVRTALTRIGHALAGIPLPN